MKSIKDLRKKDIQKRVNKGQYTDIEFNNYFLCRFINYKGIPLKIKDNGLKINYNK